VTLSRDDILGLGVMVLAAAYWAAADQIPVSLLSDAVGADGAPKMLAVALAVCGALLVVATRLKPVPAGDGEDETDPAERRRAHLRAAGLVAGLGAYALLLPILGYPLALALLIGGAAVYGGARLSPTLVAIAATGGFAFWLFFSKFLGVLLPLGIWMP
jgi:hypothetical protein